MELATIYRIVAIFLGLLIGFFSYRIYKLTKGSSKCWKYISLAGMVLFIWAGIQMPIMLTFDLPALRDISSMIAWIVLGIIIPISYVLLNQTFGIKLPKLYTVKNIMLAYSLLWAILMIYNFMTSSTKNILIELSSISHIVLFVMFLIAIYPSILLWQNTKKWPWLFIMIFTIVMGFGIILSNYTSACCYEGNPLVKDSCGEYTSTYSMAFPYSCSADFLGFAKKNHFIQIFGLVSAIIGFYGLWTKLR